MSTKIWLFSPDLDTLRRVKLSVKSDYAARAVLHLARHFQSGRAQRIEDLAAAQGVPSNYLVQILLELKARGIVRSVRGKDGGYMLARSPAEITMADILECMHGQVFDTPALNDPHCPMELRVAWKHLQSALEKTSASIDFQRLLDEAEDRQKMYYI